MAVVADVDMLSDDHIVNGQRQSVSNNADFVLNLIETLVGGSDLAGLRGRGLSSRAFSRVETMEKTAESLFQSRLSALTTDLEKSQQELQQMSGRSATETGDVATLTREQQDLRNALNQKILGIRRQLRAIRAAVRADVVALETRLKLLDILAIPAGLVIIGLLVSLWRRQRLSRYIAMLKTSPEAPS